MNILPTSWDNPSSPARLDLVFSNRFQEFGAYTLRRDYDKSLSSAFLITFGIFSLLIASPLLWNFLHQPEKEGSFINTDPEYVVIPVDLTPQPIANPPKTEPTSPPSKPSGPTVQFTTPIVTDRDSSDFSLTQQQLKDLQTGQKTDEGDSTGSTDPFPDPLVTGGGGVNDKILTWVQEMPVFPGGEEAMLNYLARNIRYPESARTNGLSGIVYLKFIVGTDGEIGGIEVIRGIGGGCEEEAVRVVKKMPRWRPGKQNGQAVRVQFNLPVNFKLR
jgi:protein TonB